MSGGLHSGARRIDSGLVGLGEVGELPLEAQRKLAKDNPNHKSVADNRLGRSRKCQVSIMTLVRATPLMGIALFAVPRKLSREFCVNDWALGQPPSSIYCSRLYSRDTT